VFDLVEIAQLYLAVLVDPYIELFVHSDCFFYLLYLLHEIFALGDSDQGVGSQSFVAHLFEQQQTGMVSAQILGFAHGLVLYDVCSKKGTVFTDYPAFCGKLESVPTARDRNVVAAIDKGVVVKISAVFGMYQLHSRG
jgi:hypothetical protein